MKDLFNTAAQWLCENLSMKQLILLLMVIDFAAGAYFGFTMGWLIWS